MSFVQLNIIFVGVAIAVIAVALLTQVAGANGPKVVAAVLGSTVVLSLLTAVFDNVMIASGLFDYAGHTLNGLHIGLAPIEDFAYPIAGALLLPGLWLLLARKKRS